MLDREYVKKQFEGLSEEEALRILSDEYQIQFNRFSPVLWFARVFTSNSAQDLENQLNEFLWFINYYVVPYTRTCFYVEDTVALDPSCGRQTTILYYTLTCNV